MDVQVVLVGQLRLDDLHGQTDCLESFGELVDNYLDYSF